MEGEHPNNEELNNEAQNDEQLETYLRVFRETSLILNLPDLRELNPIDDELEEQFDRVWQGIRMRQQLDISRGLTPERIQKFEQFDADESMVGKRCIVCMNDLEIGTKMIRLDCHVDHYFCKVCADRWFKDHSTCPLCRHDLK